MTTGAIFRMPLQLRVHDFDGGINVRALEGAAHLSSVERRELDDLGSAMRLRRRNHIAARAQIATAAVQPEVTVGPCSDDRWIGIGTIVVGVVRAAGRKRG